MHLDEVSRNRMLCQLTGHNLHQLVGARDLIDSKSVCDHSRQVSHLSRGTQYHILVSLSSSMEAANKGSIHSIIRC